MNEALTAQLIALALQEAPAAIWILTSLFKQQHPDEAPPTSEEVIAAWQSAFASSLAKDEAWMRAHQMS